MNIFVNEILQDNTTEFMYRVLWIDISNVILYMILLGKENAIPEKRRISELKELLITGDWIKLKDDNLSDIYSDEYEEKHYLIRDNAWNLIKELVVQEPEIYEKNFRSKSIDNICKQKGTTYPTIRKYLYRYWSKGKNINALLPLYKNSGGKGKERIPGEKKLGRPSVYGLKGINVGLKEKQHFRIAIEKYYLTTKKNSLTDAYKFMLKEFYVSETYYEKGVEKIILLDEDETPTFRQFEYWFKKEYAAPEIITARKGEKIFNKDHRAVLSNSLSEVDGPGARFQIDATIGDVYLVSQINRSWIIGRPVIYMVIDVFSRMVVGMNIGLEGPSWNGAMMALINVVKNKKEFCEEYNIQISKEDWPSNHLPEILLADKGEFEGYNVERLIKAFNLHVENAASYRADWKGIVEKQFDLIQKKVKPLLPGYIDTDFQQRGAKDYRLDAKLTLFEFSQILIKQIIQYNKSHYLKSYIRDKDLVEENVLPIPLNIWNWGVRNRSGKLKIVSEEALKLQLLPRGKATVNHTGIHFKGISYGCEKAIKENWFENARMNGSWKIDIAYDSRNMNNFYIINEKDSKFELGFMLEGSKRYSNLSLDEINYWRSKEKILEKGQNQNQRQNAVDYLQDIEGIINEATLETNKAQDKTISNSKRVGSIREHRKLEKKLQRIVETNTGQSLNHKYDLKDREENIDISRPNVRSFFKRRNEGEKNEF